MHRSSPLLQCACWAEARIKITRMTLTIKLDRNWSSFQLANSAPPLSVTGSAIAPSARMHTMARPQVGETPNNDFEYAVASMLTLWPITSRSHIRAGIPGRLSTSQSPPQTKKWAAMWSPYLSNPRSGYYGRSHSVPRVVHYGRLPVYTSGPRLKVGALRKAPCGGAPPEKAAHPENFDCKF